MEEDIEQDMEGAEGEEEDGQKLNEDSVDFDEFRQIIENNEDESKNKASQAR